MRRRPAAGAGVAGGPFLRVCPAAEDPPRSLPRQGPGNSATFEKFQRPGRGGARWGCRPHLSFLGVVRAQGSDPRSGLG